MVRDVEGMETSQSVLDMCQIPFNEMNPLRSARLRGSNETLLSPHLRERERETFERSLASYLTRNELACVPNPLNQRSISFSFLVLVRDVLQGGCGVLQELSVV